MTNADYIAQLEACKFDDPAVSRLVTSSYTQVMFDQKVYEKSVTNPVGAQNYFRGFFGNEVWPDGVGMDQVREYYAAPYIPYSFQRFQEAMRVCDPSLANECNFDMCKVPEGGRGTMPPFHFLKWGFELPRTCIANIRSIRDFRYWASRIIATREALDEQTMNQFYTLAAIKTTGHKITMQGARDAAGNLRVINSNNPRNPLRMGNYNYMEELFPQITNVENLVPVTLDHLQRLARYWEQFGFTNDTGVRGPRGEKIWEMWTPDDWYEQTVLEDPDYLQRISYTKPAMLFAGTKLDSEGSREIIKNWSMRTMSWLPRFTVNTLGEIVPVDSHTGVDIEVGQEFVGAEEFENAPIGLMVMVSGKQGTILTRPTLTTDALGNPIQPISGNSGWIVNNAYDATCNKFQNMPFSYKTYEMGFRMDDPDAAMSFLYRRRVYNQRPINDCDLAPIVAKAPGTNTCPITTIGCSVGKVQVEEGITMIGTGTRIECTNGSCSNTGSGTSLYKVLVKRKANQPDYNSLGCACGAAVTLFVHGDDGQYLRTVQGTLKDDSMGFPMGIYFVEVAAPLASGECFRFVTCTDATPLQGNVEQAFDNSTPGFSGITGVMFLLDSPLGCPSGETVQVRYYNAAGLVLGTVNGTIAQAWPEQMRYRVTSGNPALKADPNAAFAGAVSIGVSCSQSPHTSSSSSGD